MCEWTLSWLFLICSFSAYLNKMFSSLPASECMSEWTMNCHCVSTGHGGPHGLHHDCAHNSGHFSRHLHPSLHRVSLQKASPPFFPAHLGLSGCHGLPLYVLWWDHLSMGPGETWVTTLSQHSISVFSHSCLCSSVSAFDLYGYRS